MEYEINYVDTFFYIGEFILQIGKECLAEKNSKLLWMREKKSM